MPWLINVSVADVEGESLLYGMREVALATGSACNTTSGEPSFVLRALGRSDTLAQSSLRFSLGRGTTSEQIEQVLTRFAEVVTRLRALAGPLLHAGGAQR